MVVNNTFRFNPNSPLRREEQAYEHFKLVWMLSHGHTLSELLSIIEECMTEYCEDFDEALDNFEKNIGFHGELWPCFDEFLQCEYHECGYDKEDT